MIVRDKCTFESFRRWRRARSGGEHGPVHLPRQSWFPWRKFRVTLLLGSRSLSEVSKMSRQRDRKESSTRPIDGNFCTPRNISPRFFDHLIHLCKLTYLSFTRWIFFFLSFFSFFFFWRGRGRRRGHDLCFVRRNANLLFQQISFQNCHSCSYEGFSSWWVLSCNLWIFFLQVKLN